MAACLLIGAHRAGAILLAGGTAKGNSTSTMTMTQFTFDRLARGNLVVRMLGADEPRQECATCGESAVQQLSVGGIALTYYCCLGHAVASEV